MSGTMNGGKKAAATNIAKYGENFYKENGRKGGAVSHPKTRYFSLHPELAREAGRRGGKISKRGKAKKNKEEK